MFLLDVASCGSHHYNEPSHLDVTVGSGGNSNTVLLEGYQGARNEFYISSNLRWSITVSGKDMQWLEFAPTSGVGNAKITVAARSSNESVNDRVSYVHVNGEDFRREVKVVQVSNYPVGKE